VTSFIVIEQWEHSAPKISQNVLEEIRVRIDEKGVIGKGTVPSTGQLGSEKVAFTDECFACCHECALSDLQSEPTVSGPRWSSEVGKRSHIGLSRSVRKQGGKIKVAKVGQQVEVPNEEGVELHLGWWEVQNGWGDGAFILALSTTRRDSRHLMHLFFGRSYNAVLPRNIKQTANASRDDPRFNQESPKIA
jgi:hypothetical protein